MKRRWIVLALALVMLTSSAVLLNINPVEPMGLPAGLLPGDLLGELPADGDRRLQLTLSEKGHFFEGSVEVSILASVPDAKIYYTIDGSEPTSASREYSRPLTFGAFRGLTVVTLKAIAVHGSVTTNTLAHTFFISRDIDGRFDSDTLIFSLSTDSDHLYDYDTGIFVGGRLRDDFRRENPGRDIIPPDPANFNWRGMRGERPVYVEVFTPDGQRVIAQAAGMRVHGGWSRAAEQKSIRLVARREYESGMGSFRYNFFPGDVSADEFGTPIVRYDHIILRNGANDRDFGMLRHELGCQLAHMAGLRVATPSRPAAIFLNGEYYGFAWLNVRVQNSRYLQDVYNAPTRDFQVVGRGELWIDTDCDEERAAIEHLHGYIWRDLTNDRIFAEFEELVDIDNLLLYYAFQTFMGNNDWPGGNMRRWRYTGPQTEGLAPELDGRWRHITYDLDWTLGLYDNPVNPNIPTFRQMMNENHGRYSHMLNALFKREDMRDRFSLMMCDIAANIVTERNVRDLIERLYAEAYNEIGEALGARKYAGWVGRHTIEDNHRNMITFARERGGNMIRSLQTHFDYGYDMFDVIVAGGEAVIGTQKGSSSRYFAHLTIPLRPALPGFTVFDHWIVNGEKIYEPEITVSIADARHGAVNVELVTREELPPLMFGEAYASSVRSGCVLINPNGQTVRTNGLFLSNDPANPFLWEIPSASVAPGGTLEFAGRNGAGPGDAMFIQMAFNVRSGMVLLLSDAEGNVLDHIAVH